MRFIAQLIFSFFSNLVAVMAAVLLVSGFEVSMTVANLLIVVGLLTIANVLIRPILRAILSPLIVLTFGLFSLAINAAILFGLDLVSINLNINGLAPLIYATLVISAINLVITLSARALFRKI